MIQGGARQDQPRVGHQRAEGPIRREAGRRHQVSGLASWPAIRLYVLPAKSPLINNSGKSNSPLLAFCLLNNASSCAIVTNSCED